MAASTAGREAPPCPPRAYSATNPNDETTTEAQAATAPASRTDVAFLGSTAITNHHADPGSNEHCGQRSAEQMSAHSGNNREIEHLENEDEGGDQTGERNLPILKELPGPAKAGAETG